MNKHIVLFIKRTNASLTLESAFVIPLFLSLLFIIMLIGIAMLNVNMNHYVQLTAVERTAFIWDKYDRQFDTGVRQSQLNYDMYEHDLVLTMISKLFRLNRDKPLVVVPITKKTDLVYSGHLKQDKLNQTNHYLSKGQLSLLGAIQFEHKGFLPRITLHSIQSQLPLNLKFNSTISAIIVDGPQHIRGVDLLIYYSEKLQALTNENEREQWMVKAQSTFPSSKK